MRLYYATDKDTVFKILQEGIKPSIDGNVYLSNDITTASVYGRYRYADACVVPVELDENDVHEVDMDDDGMNKILESETGQDEGDRSDTTYSHKGMIGFEHLPKEGLCAILICN